MTDHTTPTEPLDLDAIEARANAATKGPWCTDSWEIYQGTEYEPGISEWIGETCRGATTLEQDRADASFVAHARTDVPGIVTEVRRLRAELATAIGERDCLAMAVLFASQWTPEAPMTLREGIDEILATMPDAAEGDVTAAVAAVEAGE